MTDNHGGTHPPQPGDSSKNTGKNRQPEGEQPETKPKKPGRKGIFDIYAAYNPKHQQARLGLTITINRRPETKK